MKWPPNQAWTSTRKRVGFRHFVLKQFGGTGENRWIELSPLLNKEILFRVPLTELKDHEEWESGWLQLPEGEACNPEKDFKN